MCVLFFISHVDVRGPVSCVVAFESMTDNLISLYSMNAYKRQWSVKITRIRQRRLSCNPEIRGYIYVFVLAQNVIALVLAKMSKAIFSHVKGEKKPSIKLFVLRM